MPTNLGLAKLDLPERALGTTAVPILISNWNQLHIWAYHISPISR
jgi:hypothetical protein